MVDLGIDRILLNVYVHGTVSSDLPSSSSSKLDISMFHHPKMIDQMFISTHKDMALYEASLLV